MKLLLSCLLSFSFTLSAWAAVTELPELPCADAYEQKFKKIEQHRFWRKVGDVAITGLFVSGGAAAGIGVVGGVGAYFLTLTSGAGLIFPALGGWAGYAFHSVIDLEYSLQQAYATQILAQVPVQELERNPISGLRAQTGIDEIVFFMKLKESDESYEQVRQKILVLNETGAFCPEGRKRPLSFAEMAKLIKKEIISQQSLPN